MEDQPPETRHRVRGGVRFTYDAAGRRTEKLSQRYQSGSLAATRRSHYLYHGWDLLAERCSDAAGALLYERLYTWGLDLSGRRGGAGGAGGLLSYRETRGSTTVTYYPLYDVLGNVVGVADGSGALVAEYQWGPFGELMGGSGARTADNPVRWATRYQDDETGFVYFGYRYYDPGSGTWLSREPLGEDESLNLYAYAGNDPVNHVDVLGLAKVALNEDRSLNAFGRALANIAQSDPQAARSLLLAAQVRAEISGAGLDGLMGNGGGAAIGATSRAIGVAVSRAFGDGRGEWLKIGNAAGLGIDATWWSTELPSLATVVSGEFGKIAPLLSAAASTDARMRAQSAALTAYQNSAGYKLKEIADFPMDVLAFGFSAAMGTDITTGSMVTWKGFNNGGGFGLAEVSPGERAFAAGLVFLPIGRGGSMVDDVARAGMRGGGPGGWMIRAEGTRLKQVGNYWIKEVNPDANALARWWGSGSLNAQAKALDKLGDMAPSHLFKNGKLVMRDAGQYEPGSFWSTWLQGSKRLGTPMNDIRPRNIGANGLIFDPALHPVQRGIYWFGAGTVGASAGYGIYSIFDE